jgi:DNA-binding transcriptional LysR family regulator
VARHLSIAKAAEELGITQSAVSHQLRRLSSELGERLTIRMGRTTALTDSGRRLAEELSDVFDRIERSTTRLIGMDKETVRLAVCTSFGPGWLSQRLQSFYAEYPEVDLVMEMYGESPELTDRVADAFVSSPPFAEGFWTSLIYRELLVPVCAPSLLQSSTGIGDLPLISVYDEMSHAGTDWRDYGEHAGMSATMFSGAAWRGCSHYFMALEMARNGLGAALVPDFLTRDDLASGKLVMLCDVSMPTGQDYYLCIKHSRRQEPGLQKLARWFRTQKT